MYSCDVQVKEIDNATKIFGKSIYEMKGKSTRAKTEPIVEDSLYNQPFKFKIDIE